MFSGSDSLENAAEQDGAHSNTDHFPAPHFNVASNVVSIYNLFLNIFKGTVVNSFLFVCFY